MATNLVAGGRRDPSFGAQPAQGAAAVDLGLIPALQHPPGLTGTLLSVPNPTPADPIATVVEECVLRARPQMERARDPNAIPPARPWCEGRLLGAC